VKGNENCGTVMMILEFWQFVHDIHVCS